MPRYGLEGTIILGAVKNTVISSESDQSSIKRTLIFDEKSQTLSVENDTSGALKLRIFDEVKVRTCYW